MADEEELSANWTIKDVSVETRKLAVKCAGKRGEKVGVWMGRAAQTLANIEANDAVFQPGQRETTKPQEARPTVGPMQANVLAKDLADLMQGMAALTQATGVKPAIKDVRRAYAVMDCLVREGGGLPPRQLPMSRPKVAPKPTIDGLADSDSPLAPPLARLNGVTIDG